MDFFGTYWPRLDEKGRLILPAKYRDRFREGLVVTKGQEYCLYVFTMEEFRQVREKIVAAATGSRQMRAFVRVFLAGASDEIPDRQGRITIPPALREYAGLDRETAVVGTGERLEIWNADAWREYSATEEEAFASMADVVIPGML